MALNDVFMVIWIILVITVIPYNWYLDSKYVKKRLSEPINKDDIDEKPVIHHINTLHNETIYGLYEKIKIWIQEYNGEILSELEPIEIEYIYPKGASVSGYRVSILDALKKDLVKISLKTQHNQSVILDVKFYPVEKVKFNSYRLDRIYRYFSLLEKMYNSIGYVVDDSLMKNIYQIDVVKYRLDKRLKNMVLYCSFTIISAILLFYYDDLVSSHIRDFVMVGKLFVIIFAVGVPYSIWEYLSDREFYKKISS